MDLDPRARNAVRLGVFGGTFDPVHLGHLHVARVAQARFRLDHIVFIPARQSPHKRAGASASGADRLAMLQLAIDSDKQLAPLASVWDFELMQPGVSYTVTTLEELTRLREEGSSKQLVFLMGSDQFKGLPKWTQVERVFQLAKPCVVLRKGWSQGDLACLEGQLSDQLMADLRAGFLEPNPVELSATELREKLAKVGHRKVRGDGTREEQPLAVSAYIERKGLYSAPQDGRHEAT